MSEIPWSAKGSKVTAGVAADEVMILDSEDAALATKNKRMGYQNLADSLLNLSSVAGLTDGTSTILSSAQIVFEQGGSKFRTTFVPNPINQVNVINQAQLEAEFGTDIEIPDGESIKISINDSFTMTKPFKIGLDSSLEIAGINTQTDLTYTGPGALFQNTVSTDLIHQFSLNKLAVIGNGTNDLFNLRGTASFLLDLLGFVSFASLGFVEMGIVDWKNTAMFSLGQGVVIKNPPSLVIDGVSISQTSSTNMTLFSFILEDPNISLSINRVTSEGSFGAGDSLFFLDPNSTADSGYVITQSSTLAASDFYQLGTDIAATGAAASGSDTQFDITAHGLVIGQVVVLKDFTTFTGYNGTFRVTAVNDANSVDIEVGFLGVDSTGVMNEASLDSTDVRVSAFANPSAQDSMFTANAGLDVSAAPFDVTINTQDVPEVITSTSWLFDDLERFTVSTNDDGELTANDPATRRYRISYNGSIGKVGGGSVNIGLVILKNGTNVTFNAPHRTAAGVGFISGTDIIELTASDTVQIGAINYDGVSDITTVQISMVISLA